MTSLATTKREAVATALRTAIEALPGGWAVYASPRDILSLPCGVLSPGSPYRTPATFGSPERIRLRVAFLVPRSQGNEALDRFDDAADACIAVLDTIAYSTDWSALSIEGEVLVNEQPALGCTFDVDVV